MRYGPYSSIEALAAAIADDLCIKDGAPLDASFAVVADVVTRVIEENFRIEEEINRAAECALAELGSATTGMDRGKLLAGLRERIAKKRGFVL